LTKREPEVGKGEGGESMGGVPVRLGFYLVHEKGVLSVPEGRAKRLKWRGSLEMAISSSDSSQLDEAGGKDKGGQPQDSPK